MNITILFDNTLDLDMFYNDFTSSMPKYVSKVEAKPATQSILMSIDTLHDDAINGKELFNEIKQYMRDHEISYTMSV
jgi:hypothetical protein